MGGLFIVISLKLLYCVGVHLHVTKLLPWAPNTSTMINRSIASLVWVDRVSVHFFYRKLSQLKLNETVHKQTEQKKKNIHYSESDSNFICRAKLSHLTDKAGHSLL